MLGNHRPCRLAETAKSPHGWQRHVCRAALTHIESNVKQVESASRLEHPLPAPPSPGCGVGAQLAGLQLGAAGALAADDLQGRGESGQRRIELVAQFPAGRSIFTAQPQRQAKRCPPTLMVTGTPARLPRGPGSWPRVAATTQMLLSPPRVGHKTSLSMAALQQAASATVAMQAARVRRQWCYGIKHSCS